MYNRSKVHVDEERFAKDITSRKCDCPFDMVALIKDNVWVLRIWEAEYNYEFTLSDVYPTHKKVEITQNKFYTKLKLVQLLSKF